MKYILIICCLFTLLGCQKEDPYADTVYTREQREPQFIEKIAVNKVDACWYESVSYSYSRRNKEQPNSVENLDMSTLDNIHFDGVNICERPADQYHTTRFYAVEKEKDDVTAINDLLSEKLYNRHITLEDLDTLKLEYISKDNIVALYNEAFDQLPRSLGDFWQNDQIEIKKYSDDDVTVTVGALINWGYLDGINLKFEQKDGKAITLSDQQIAEINASISAELIGNQSNRVESIPHSDDVITLDLVNKALDSVLIYDNE